MRHLFKSLVAEFHRLPSLIRKLGPWAFVAVGVTLVEALDEFAIALGVLVLGLVAFAVQVSDWKPTDKRYVVVKKLIYGSAASGVLAFLAVVFVKRKDQKPWSNIDALNALLASAGNAIAFAYYNTPWRFVFTAAITCVLTWFVARAWFLTPSMSGTVVNESASPGQGVVVADSLRGCEDEWLHDKLKTDKIKIKELVRFPGIMYNPDFQKAHIDFVFSVFNNSLYDIVIENSVSGEIRYGEDNDAFYYTPKFLSDTPIKCASRSGAYFVIRQAIRQEEIPRFRDTESVLIWFHDLQINFQGTKRFSEIGTTRLNTDHYLETKKRLWRDWDRLEFIFGYTNEQWALLSSRPVLPSGELQALATLVAAAPPVETGKANLVFKGIGRVYAYSLHGYPLEEGHNPEPNSDSSIEVIALTVRVENEFSDLFKTVPIRGVTAQVFYYPQKGAPFQLNRGAWLGSANRAHFDVNDLHDLVIAAVVGKDEERFVCAIHREYRDDQNGFEKVALMLPEDEYDIRVRVISEKEGLLHFEKRLVLSVTETPKFRVSLRPADEADSSEDEASNRVTDSE